MKPRNLLIAAALSASLFCFAETKTFVHVLERGETIESLASKYQTTEDEIFRLNPEAEDFLYVGMELTIPYADGVAVEETEEAEDYTEASVAPAPAKSRKDNSRKESGKGEKKSLLPNVSLRDAFLSAQATYGIGENTDLFAISAGGGFKCYRDLYVAARIGYMGSFYKKTVIDENLDRFIGKQTMHYIQIPLEAGYEFQLTEDFKVIPNIQFPLSWSVSGKSSVNMNGFDLLDESLDKGKFLISCDPGVRLRYGNIELILSYSVPLNKVFGTTPKSHFNIGLGYVLSLPIR